MASRIYPFRNGHLPGVKAAFRCERDGLPHSSRTAYPFRKPQLPNQSWTFTCAHRGKNSHWLRYDFRQAQQLGGRWLFACKKKRESTHAVRYSFRKSQTQQYRWEFTCKEKKTVAYPLSYCFRQGAYAKGSWRFAVAPEQGQLYQEDVLQAFVHRGRRLHQERTAVDFSFLNRRIYSGPQVMDFSFCQRRLEENPELPPFSYLLREADTPAETMDFSFVLREMDSAATMILFSFLLRELEAAPTVVDFSFLLRKAASPEETLDFSFIIRELDLEEQTVDFSFLIRKLLEEKTQQWLNRQKLLAELEQDGSGLQKVRSLPVALPQEPLHLQEVGRALQREDVGMLSQSASDADVWQELTLQGQKEAAVDQVASSLKKTAKQTLTGDTRSMDRIPQISVNLERSEIRVSGDKQLFESMGNHGLWTQHGLHQDQDTDTLVTGACHNWYSSMSQLALDREKRAARREDLEHLVLRHTRKQGMQEAGQRTVCRRIDKGLKREAEPVLTLRKAEKELHLEWMHWLELARNIATAKEGQFLSKEQELAVETACSLAARMLQEMQYTADNFMLVGNDRRMWILDYSRQLRRELFKNMLAVKEIAFLGKYPWKQMRSIWNPVMTEKTVTRSVWNPEKQARLKTKRVVPVLIDNGTVQAGSFHRLEEGASQVLAENHKESAWETDRQYGKTDYLQPEAWDISASTEHLTTWEEHVLGGRAPDQLNLEDDRSAELIQRFWTIAKSGFTDRIVLPDMDYPYKDRPVEFQSETKHNANWDSVFPNQFYRRIDRHPVQPGSETGKDEIDVDIAVMVDMINIFILMWFKYVRALWGWTGSQAVLGMISGMYEYMTLETTQSQLTAKGAKADYERTFRWLRWEAEAMVLAAKDDMELHGNYYVGLLLEELIAYMENHHFDVMPIFRDVNKMDEWRTLFGSELETDITWVLDKVKGIRHRKIGG